MRRLILLPAVIALTVPVFATSATAAPFTNCSPVKSGKYVLAIKVKVRGLGCTETAAFWTSFATGAQGSPTTEDLRPNCKPGSKAAERRAANKNRATYVCRSSDGTITTKAWVLQG